MAATNRPVGATKIGCIAAEAMGLLEDTSGLAEGETVSIGMVAVVAEIAIAEPAGPGRTQVFFHCSDERHWIQTALFDEARSEARALGHLGRKW